MTSKTVPLVKPMVLVVDDVPANRELLEALALIEEEEPDLVLLDIEMPGLDGLTVCRRIMVEVRTPILIVSATIDAGDAQASLNALRAGALGLCGKPTLGGSEAAANERARFLEQVRALWDVRVVRRARPVPVAAPAVGRGGLARIQSVALAASTGGPAALAHLDGRGRCRGSARRARSGRPRARAGRAVIGRLRHAPSGHRRGGRQRGRRSR